MPSGAFCASTGPVQSKLNKRTGKMIFLIVVSSLFRA
jgi:hypothetical protein